MSSSRNTTAYRKRQRVGLAVLRVSVWHYDFTQALIESKVLDVAEALDRRLVERAAGEVLMEWTRKNLLEK